MFIAGMEDTLKEVGDLGNIAKALSDIGATQQKIANLPCSKHPDRKIVALAPLETQARLCKECFDALMEDMKHGRKAVHVRRLGDASDEGASIAEGSGEAASISAREESGRDDRANDPAPDAGDLGGCGLRLTPPSGVGAGATDSNASRAVAHEGHPARGTDSEDSGGEPNFIDAYERFWK